MFELSKITVKTLASSLTMYHGLFQHNKCEAKEMEELVAKAIDMDPQYTGSVNWRSGSHEPGSDIVVGSTKLSIKSGSIRKDILTVSGNRLTKARGDFNVINSLLKSYVSDVVICLVYTEIDGVYKVVYVDSSVFLYPSEAKCWLPAMSKKSGSISSYTWSPDNGLVVKVTPAMSWQVWWHIPIAICRVGPSIPTRK